MEKSEYRVLVVDDQAYNRAILKNGLGEMGYRIEEASNGKEALEKAQSFKPHVVLMDIDMPVMNGLEATHRIHTYPGLAKTHIIIITANDHIYEFNRALQCGAVDYVVKPIVIKDIASLIEKHLTTA